MSSEELQPYEKTVNGKQTTVTIGYFDTPEEASAATAKYKDELYAELERKVQG